MPERKVDNMAEAAIVRPVDRLGRIVIPKEFRETLHITPKCECEIVPTEDGVFIKKIERDLKKELELLINRYYSDGRYAPIIDKLIEIQDEME